LNLAIFSPLLIHCVTARLFLSFFKSPYENSVAQEKFNLKIVCGSSLLFGRSEEKNHHEILRICFICLITNPKIWQRLLILIKTARNFIRLILFFY